MGKKRAKIGDVPNVAHGFRTAVGGSIRVQEHPCFLLVVLHA